MRDRGGETTWELRTLESGAFLLCSARPDSGGVAVGKSPSSNTKLEARAVRIPGGFHLTLAGYSGSCALAPPLAEASAGGHQHGAAKLTAPMPGSILRLDVAEGETVRAGQKLLVLEAMKMEHTLTAPDAGRIRRLPFKVGQIVPLGAVLVEMEE